MVESKAGIRATERESLTQLNLRGDPRDGAFLARVHQVLGVDLPIKPNTIATGMGCVAYWLGPDEWLVISTHALDLGALFSSATDVSGGQIVVMLRGAAVRELLAKECPLDLHPRALGVGQCAQTRLAKAAVLLRPVSADEMEIVVRRSFADYFRRWLEEAAMEYGLDTSISTTAENA